MQDTTETRWDYALAHCKAVYITEGANAAQELATWYLVARVITCGDYVALKRWTQGRPSYARRLWADELVG